MSAILNWIDDRTGLGGTLRRCLDRRIPGGACWCKVWPASILFAFCVQAITGFFLWMYYSPSAQTAWESVYYVQHEVVGGWLLRAVHHYSAQVMLVVIGLYLLQMIVTGAYRAPRELVFWIAVGMKLVCLGLLLTGDLLAWDQNSYMATKVRVGFVEMLPVVGGPLFKLAAGGPDFGHLTLTRFVALHIGLFSGVFLLLLILHGLATRRADAVEAAEAKRTSPVWPNQAVCNALAVTVVLVVVLLLACRHGVSGEERGVGLGSPADLANPYEAARPEWAFLGLYQFSNLFPAELKILPIFVVPGLLLVVALAMPWIARIRGGHGFNLGFVGVLLVGIVVLSFISLWKDSKDEAHQKALAAERRQAERVRDLALAKGIPATGAMTLLRNDPLTQGPRLYTQYCASCHDYEAPDETAITGDEPRAPQLYRFASREWIAGLLDPKRIVTAEYFGNTQFRRGDMVGYVREILAELEADEKDDLRKVVIAVSAEAGLPSQREMDKKDARRIEEGRTLLVEDFGCTDCHRFRGEGASDAPDLTGYGSREWLLGIISDPTDNRFYGASNDDMPSYLKDPDRPERNLLLIGQVELLADWMRGEDSQ